MSNDTEKKKKKGLVRNLSSGSSSCSSSRRLAKSTLLLIPLFGIHYVVFVCLSESMAEDYKIFFDLALGSFQVSPLLLSSFKPAAGFCPCLICGPFSSPGSGGGRSLLFPQQ